MFQFSKIQIPVGTWKNMPLTPVGLTVEVITSAILEVVQWRCVAEINSHSTRIWVDASEMTHVTLIAPTGNLTRRVGKRRRQRPERLREI